MREKGVDDEFPYFFSWRNKNVRLFLCFMQYHSSSQSSSLWLHWKSKLESSLWSDGPGNTESDALTPPMEEGKALENLQTKQSRQPWSKSQPGG